MKYAEGLNYLDQLKDYVQTSLSIRQNIDKVKNEDGRDIENSDLSKQKVEHEFENEEEAEIFEPIGNFDLFDLVKEEILEEGKITG